MPFFDIFEFVLQLLIYLFVLIFLRSHDSKLFLQIFSKFMEDLLSFPLLLDLDLQEFYLVFEHLSLGVIHLCIINISSLTGTKFNRFYFI